MAFAEANPGAYEAPKGWRHGHHAVYSVVKIYPFQKHIAPMRLANIVSQFCDDAAQA